MNLIGNKDTLANINVAVRSATEQNRSVPHMLFTGAAGCGKTSTAKHLAKMLGSDFLSIACDSLKKREDLLLIIDKLNCDGYDKYGYLVNKIKPTVIFIDEIHGLSMAAQENLGIMMEEWKLPVKTEELRIDPIELIRKGHLSQEEARSRWCPQFTLVGATTNDGKLSKPFRDRFKLRCVFSTYSMEESIEIAKVHAERLEIKIDEQAAIEIAKRGRGVPRTIVSLLERCRDTAVVASSNIITSAITLLTFEHHKIDNNGLNKGDIEVLKILNRSKAPIGLENLAIQLNESPKVLSETTEPFLIQQGFITRGSKGREITDEGRRYMIDNGHIDIEENAHEHYDIPENMYRGF